MCFVWICRAFVEGDVCAFGVKPVLSMMIALDGCLFVEVDDFVADVACVCDDGVCVWTRIRFNVPRLQDDERQPQRELSGRRTHKKWAMCPPVGRAGS